MAAPVLTLAVVLALLLLLLVAAGVFFFYFFRLPPKPNTAAAADLEKGPPGETPADDPHRKTGHSPLRRYSWGEIGRMTAGLSSAVIGEGGFSTVYLGVSEEEGPVAVKVHRDSERMHRVFQSELEVLLRLRRHENVVRLLGYCDEGDEGALVFEYIPNGTLHENLHEIGGGGGGRAVLPWSDRMWIAYKLALALEHIHEKCDLQILHCDIKPSNVLLDERLSPKLSDFGSAKMGFSSTVLPGLLAAATNKAIVGSVGYSDPHYLRTGVVSKKSDVYSFGVLALELVTGLEAFAEGEGRVLAAAAVESGVAADPRLLGAYDGGELEAVVRLAGRCVGAQMSSRPSMGEIAGVLRESLSGSISAVEGRSKGEVKAIRS